MKKILLIIIFTFSLQTLIKADDIKDFEIEGISIGDSLLDYFSKKEILDNSKADYESKKFIRFIPNNQSMKLNRYDAINFHYKDKTEYKIYEISGGIIFNNNHKKCKIKMNQIISDIEEVLIGFSKIDRGTTPFLEIDSSGKSIVSRVKFEKKNSGIVWVACYDYSKKIEDEYLWKDSLRISVNNMEFENWLNTEAY